MVIWGMNVIRCLKGDWTLLQVPSTRVSESGTWELCKLLCLMVVVFMKRSNARTLLHPLWNKWPKIHPFLIVSRSTWENIDLGNWSRVIESPISPTKKNLTASQRDQIVSTRRPDPRQALGRSKVPWILPTKSSALCNSWSSCPGTTGRLTGTLILRAVRCCKKRP